MLMSNNQTKTMLLEAMDIQQWLSREKVTEETPAAEMAIANNTVGIAVSVTGNADSGWLWLTEGPVSENEQNLLADIQRAVNCADGGLLAYADAVSTAVQPLELVLADKNIHRLVIFGKRSFQEEVLASLKQAPTAKISTLALAELAQTPTAKRQLWAELKKLLAQ